MKKITWMFIVLGLVVCLSDCKKEEESVPLIADAGPSQTVMPRKEVTLDGSRSSGPEGFTYSWSYAGEVSGEGRFRSNEFSFKK